LSLMSRTAFIIFPMQSMLDASTWSVIATAR
jgi:hypothetical protein